MNGQYGVYRVTGRRSYRGHPPGTIFEAALDPGPEQRAIARGDIRLLRYVVPEIVAGSARLPAGWGENVNRDAAASQTTGGR